MSPEIPDSPEQPEAIRDLSTNTLVDLMETANAAYYSNSYEEMRTSLHDIYLGLRDIIDAKGKVN